MHGRCLRWLAGVCSAALMMTACGQSSQAPQRAVSAPAPRHEKNAAAVPMIVHATRADGNQSTFNVFLSHGSACAPLALISPGAGSDGDPVALAYLGAALQRSGWQAIVMHHKESDLESLRDRIRRDGIRDGLLELTTNPAAYKDRFYDIGAALAWSQARCEPPFVALIGHSMGAATVMLEAGAKNRLGLDGENRFDAYVALSPQGPGSIFPPHAWEGIGKPLLIMTGTRDAALEGTWKTRTIPYDDLPPGCHWLGVVDNANHLNFAGFGYGRDDVEGVVIPTIIQFLADAQRHACPRPQDLPGLTLTVK